MESASGDFDTVRFLMMGTRGRGVRTTLLAALVALVVACPGTAYAGPFSGPLFSGPTLAVTWPPCFERSTAIQLGLTESARSVAPGGRLIDITLQSSATRSAQHVNVLLPVGYDPSGATRYPVLYLLHGSLQTYRSWVTDGDVEAILGATPMIVVMPDDSGTGSYSDWYGVTSPLGTTSVPSWESYHLRELVPWVDAHYPTIPTAGGRVVAGLSSGGGGAMKYAAATPGLFGYAGSFSGAVHITLPNYYPIGEVSSLLGVPQDGHCTWGNPYSQEILWQDNDPVYLASNLRGTALWAAYGNGSPGPLDGPLATPDPIERVVAAMNLRFDWALDAAGVPATIIDYGNGTHTWPYWQRDLRQFLTWLTPQLGPRPVPTFRDRSARPAFTAWGWSFRPHRLVREFTYLDNVSPAGLDVTGSGTLDVETAPNHEPGRLHRLTFGPVTGWTVSTATVRADATGRLRFTVDLGPSHLRPQTDFGPGATFGWTHVRVDITPT